MYILYRISDTGYKKDKPDYINNRNCFRNALKTFPNAVWIIIADNCGERTINMLVNTLNECNITNYKINQVRVGNGAASFNLALDYVLQLTDNDTRTVLNPMEIIYFLENDYLHLPGSESKLIDMFDNLEPDFATLYCCPDKFITPQEGGNPNVEWDGGYLTKVYFCSNQWWCMADSTTMTFAARLRTIVKHEDILRKHTNGNHPWDYQMFMELRDNDASLLMPIPSLSTHGETAWLASYNTQDVKRNLIEDWNLIDK